MGCAFGELRALASAGQGGGFPGEEGGATQGCGRGVGACVATDELSPISPSLPFSHLLALREGGVAGAEGAPAPYGAVPPPSGAPAGGGGRVARCAGFKWLAIGRALGGLSLRGSEGQEWAAQGSRTNG